MPLGLWSIEYQNLNAQRKYPLADDATAVDSTGEFALPDSFLVELDIPVGWSLDVDTTRFFVRAVTVFPIGYALTIAYDDGTGDPPPVATTSFARSTHQENTTYGLTGVGDFAEIQGTVTIGLLDEIDRRPPGVWTFTPAGGKLDPTTIRPMIRGVTSFAVTNGAETSPPIRGDVELVAGNNVRLVADGQTIRVDAIEGANLTATCQCTGDAALESPIRTINGVAADASGNIALVGNQCLSIAAMQAGIALSDDCSQPCCGDPEMDALIAELTHTTAEAETVARFVERLRTLFDGFSAVVLGSRLADGTCPALPEEPTP